MNKLKNYFSYKKFSQEKHRVLYLNDNYFLQQASVVAIEKLGHTVYSLKLERDPSLMLEKLLKACVEFKPDCLMGINHGGYDPEGKIAAIINDLGLPVLFWYLDDFRFIIFNGKHHANSNTAIFTFEKNHVQLLKNLNFEHVFYLPSAASVNKKTNFYKTRYDFLKESVSFVGNTFSDTKILREKPTYNNLLTKIKNRINFTTLHNNLVEEIEKIVKDDFEVLDDLFHFAGFIIAEATQKYRQHFLNSLQTKEFNLFGDENWKKILHQGKMHPPTQYETETPFIYHNSLINLNLSSQQLENTVSLRVFDVPAAGGFLLTDWKESLADLFDEKNELAFFTSVDEMNDKIAYFKINENKREKIKQNAMKRVVNEHMIFHRIEYMLKTAKEIWG